MHCVYSAFAHHIEYLGESNYARVYDIYKSRKIQSHGNLHQYTFAGVLPWLYRYMLVEHNLHTQNQITMRIERSYVTLPEYMPSAQNEIQREIMFKHTRYWGREVDKVSITPAIYCLLNEQHAQFAIEVPSWPGARILFAVRLLYRKEIEKENSDDRTN